MGKDRRHSQGAPPDTGHEHGGHDHSHSQPLGNQAVSQFMQQNNDRVMGTVHFPDSYAAAIAQHRQQQARLQTLVQAGLRTTVSDDDTGSPDLLWRNTCQMVRDGFFQAKVMTPLHDNLEYGEQSQVYFFGELGDDYEPGNPFQYYGAAPTAIGRRTLDVLFLFDSTRLSDENLRETLVHECQHAAGGEAQDNVNDQIAFGRVEDRDREAHASHYKLYEEEFRAFWIAHQSGDPNNAPVQFSLNTNLAGDEEDQAVSAGRTTNFQNEKQSLVFRDFLMHGQVNHRDWWDHDSHQPAFSYAFAPHFYILDDRFFDFVNGLDHPLTANGINSVRLAELERAVDSGEELDAIHKILGTLEPTDKTYLQTPDSSPFWDAVAIHDDNSLETIIRAYLI